MKNILYKELRLVIMPGIYLFSLLSFMLLIPQYPYFVGISYAVFAVFITFNAAQASNDHKLTAMLPVPRNYIVAGKHVTVIVLEVIQLLVAIPAALISSLVLYPDGNPVGMDANFAFFGFSLIAYSVYNLIFLPWYFKTGYRTGIPTIFAMTGYLVTVVLIECVVNLFPAIHAAVDSLEPSTCPVQLIVLAAGIVIYCCAIALSYRISCKNFERVSL